MARKSSSNGQAILPISYDDRFLQSYVGNKLLSDPVTAIVELIANSWDAGATLVKIEWPDAMVQQGSSNERIVISDNGEGMTEDEFKHRWPTFSYNRTKEQSRVVSIPRGKDITPILRETFGQNGVGRWAGFCFANSYKVVTCKNQLLNSFKVTWTKNPPVKIDHELVNVDTSNKGTTITIENLHSLPLTSEDIREQIGMRFLANPDFKIEVNGKVVEFDDISDLNKEIIELEIEEGKTAQLIFIDTQSTDRTSLQHGIAWHINDRLVGECSWKPIGLSEYISAIIDRRRSVFKRLTFIINANFLKGADAIKPDWSGFYKENSLFSKTAKTVYEEIGKQLLNYSEDDRKRTLSEARHQNHNAYEEMSPLSRERWTKFVMEAQEKCPSVREADIVKLSEVMANLELADSQYALLDKMSQYSPDQLEELNKLLEEWTLDMAKQVLDEIARRLKIVDELEIRLHDDRTREVQDMQPLFKKALWIFGPEYETIEYTSNQSMVNVIQQLHGKKDVTASKNRPDFVILPDGSTGLYSRPKYDEDDGGENGVEKLVIIELKKPNIKIGESQKSQCWNYVKELTEKGLINEKFTHVRCFVIGSEVDSQEAHERSERHRLVLITPLLFDSVIKRAKSRLLKLHERVKEAPFLEEHRQELEDFIKPVESESNLFESVA